MNVYSKYFYLLKRIIGQICGDTRDYDAWCLSISDAIKEYKNPWYVWIMIFNLYWLFYFTMKDFVQIFWNKLSWQSHTREVCEMELGYVM